MKNLIRLISAHIVKFFIKTKYVNNDNAFRFKVIEVTISKSNQDVDELITEISYEDRVVNFELREMKPEILSIGDRKLCRMNFKQISPNEWQKNGF